METDVTYGRLFQSCTVRPKIFKIKHALFSRNVSGYFSRECLKHSCILPVPLAIHLSLKRFRTKCKYARNPVVVFRNLRCIYYLLYVLHVASP